MSYPLSERVRAMSASATLAMAAKASELKNQGVDIISLSLGEPDFSPPPHVLEAAHKALEEGYHKYTTVDGYRELREAICRKFKRENGLDYSPEQIVVSTGAKQCLANVALCLIDNDDEVIIPAPYWVSYSDLIKLAGGKPIELETNIDTDFKIRAEDLERAITDKTKMLWINSPCNPSGSVYSRDELEALAQVLRKYPHILICSDEIYEHIRFEGEHISIASLEGMSDRTITINGVSKAFAMTGWRIGYMAAPEWIAKACIKMQGQITSGANSIAQRATIAALDAPVSTIQYMIDEFRHRRDLVLEGLRKIPGLKVNKPEGAFYIFIDVSSFYGSTLKGQLIQDSNDMAMYLLQEAKVATVAGVAFGSPNCLRISYATSRELLSKAIERISTALS